MQHFYKHMTIVSEYNFKPFPQGVVFPKKRKKYKIFQRLATSSRHNSAMIKDQRKFITK